MFMRDDCWETCDETILLFSIISTFRDIICLMYSRLEDRCPSLILNLYVRTFLLFKLIGKAWRLFKEIDGLKYPNKLPFHQMMTHFPYQSRIFPVSELSTEDFEALWKFLRFREKNFRIQL